MPEHGAGCLVYLAAASTPPGIALGGRTKEIIPAAREAIATARQSQQSWRGRRWTSDEHALFEPREQARMPTARARRTLDIDISFKPRVAIRPIITPCPGAVRSTQGKH